MQDSLRLSKLKERMEGMSYWTKPKLDETLILKESDQRSRQVRSSSARERTQRDRSASSSGRLERTFRDKYSHVKPKTVTRPGTQSARGEHSVNDSQHDLLNDSSSIRFFLLITHFSDFILKMDVYENMIPSKNV